MVFFYGDAFWGSSQPEHTFSFAEKPAEKSGRDFIYPEYCFNAVVKDSKRVSSELTIKYTNNFSRPLDEIRMILPANVLSGESYIKLNSLEVLNRSGTLLEEHGTVTIYLSGSLKPGEQVEIKTQFDTVLPRQANKFGYYRKALRLSNWYPVVAPFDNAEEQWVSFEKLEFGDPYYYEAAFFKGTVESPAGWQVISPFTISKKNGQSKDAVVLDSVLPVRDCTLVIGTGFKLSKLSVGSTEVEYFFQDRDRKFAPLAVGVLEFYHQVLGDYPYGRLVLVDFPMEDYMGMEFSGMVFLSSLSGNIGQKTVAHEIAHQYWYGLVGSNQIKEPWVDEGLADYCALLYLEHREGKESYCRAIKNINPQGNSYLSFLPVSAYPNKEVYKEAVYYQPAIFWNRVRKLGGTEHLFRVLNRVQKDFRFQVLSAGDLFNVLKEEYGLNNHELRNLLFIDHKSGIKKR